MIQNLLLGALVFLCILLIVSLIRKPFDQRVKNPCRFKILSPKFTIKGNKKHVSFNIIVEKHHRYFINFPLLFKFYSDSKFRSEVKAYYTISEDNKDLKKNLILDKKIEFIDKTKEYIIYITDIIMGKIMIEVELIIEEGNPVIGFEIMENSTCTLMKEHKIEIKFPE
jgi:hypothetical protein